MSTIRVKYQAGTGWSFNSKNNDEGIEHMTAESLVELSLNDASSLTSGELETMRVRQERLAEIVGHLLERVPSSEWLEITCMQYTLEEVR